MFLLYADIHWLSIIHKKQYIGVKKNINWRSYTHQSEFLSQAIEQTSASIFQYVKYIFKSLSPAIIRIRNVFQYVKYIFKSLSPAIIRIRNVVLPSPDNSRSSGLFSVPFPHQELFPSRHQYCGHPYPKSNRTHKNHQYGQDVNGE